MTKNTGFGQGLNMPAFNKGAGSGPIDLMRPGNGTPWEDRGSSGGVGAYFKTMIKSMFSPALLLDHIRRPESTGDSISFVVTSCVMWVLGVFIYNAYWLWYVLPNGTTIYEKDPDSTTNYWLTALMQAVLVSAGLFLFLKVGPKLYRSLAATELKGANPTLIQNCFNYCMGPSILALFPFGWALAAVWIVFDLMVAGKRRLYLKSSSAIINVLIMAFIVAAIVVVVDYLFFGFIWGKMLEMNGLIIKEAPKQIVLPTRD